MRITLILFGLLLGSVGAQAADFTGFYAGVNAGYGFGHGRDKSDGSAALPGSGEAGADRSLPPSAASASRAMQDARPRSGRPSR